MERKKRTTPQQTSSTQETHACDRWRCVLFAAVTRLAKGEQHRPRREDHRAGHQDDELTRVQPVHAAERELRAVPDVPEEASAKTITNIFPYVSMIIGSALQALLPLGPRTEVTLPEFRLDRRSHSGNLLLLRGIECRVIVSLFLFRLLGGLQVLLTFRTSTSSEYQRSHHSEVRIPGCHQERQQRGNDHRRRSYSSDSWPPSRNEELARPEPKDGWIDVCLKETFSFRKRGSQLLLPLVPRLFAFLLHFDIQCTV